MSGVWKQSYGRTSEAPPNERGGNRYVRPTATAPHLDSTEPCGSIVVSRTTGRRHLAVHHGMAKVGNPPARGLWLRSRLSQLVASRVMPEGRFRQLWWFSNGRQFAIRPSAAPRSGLAHQSPVSNHRLTASGAVPPRPAAPAHPRAPGTHRQPSRPWSRRTTESARERRICKVERDRIVQHPAHSRRRHCPAIRPAILVEPSGDLSVAPAQTVRRNGDPDPHREAAFGHPAPSNAVRSKRRTRKPRAAQLIAAALPAGPPPTMATSVSTRASTDHRASAEHSCCRCRRWRLRRCRPASS
jgi:hypothetical protein